MSYPPDLEALIMDSQERQELAVAIVQAMITTPRPPPTAGEHAQRLLAILGPLVGLIGVLVAATGWAFSLQGQLQAMASDVADTKATAASLTEKTDRILSDRWTRSEHDAFVQSELRPLEVRIRALETTRGR